MPSITSRMESDDIRDGQRACHTGSQLLADADIFKIPGVCRARRVLCVNAADPGEIFIRVLRGLDGTIFTLLACRLALSEYFAETVDGHHLAALVQLDRPAHPVDLAAGEFRRLHLEGLRALEAVKRIPWEDGTVELPLTTGNEHVDTAEDAFRTGFEIRVQWVAEHRLVDDAGHHGGGNHRTPASAGRVLGIHEQRVVTPAAVGKATDVINRGRVDLLIVPGREIDTEQQAGALDIMVGQRVRRGFFKLLPELFFDLNLSHCRYTPPPRPTSIPTSS